MPRATYAAIHVDEALTLREAGLRPEYRCVECHEPVRAHKKGTTEQAAHFEHLVHNPECSLSE